MTNSNTTSTTNARTVRERLVVVTTKFRTWTGTRAMHAEDYRLGADGELPPEAVAASYGLKAIINPKVLKPINDVVNKVSGLLDSVGVKFLGGTALDKSVAKTVLPELKQFQKEYEEVKADFMSNYDRYVEQWAAENPKFSEQILSAKLDMSALDRKLTATYSAIGIVPVGTSEAEIKEFDDQVSNDLTAEMLNAISGEAQRYLRDSFGPGRESANQRLPKTLIKLQKRLDSLSFLAPGISPLVKTIQIALNRVPTQGAIGGTAFWILKSTTQFLADRTLLASIVRGEVSAESLLADAERSLAQKTAPAAETLVPAPAAVPAPAPVVEEVPVAPDLDPSSIEAFFAQPAAEPAARSIFDGCEDVLAVTKEAVESAKEEASADADALLAFSEIALDHPGVKAPEQEQVELPWF